LKKVRVFELAKDYGMKGPDLAKLLREIGFDKVKGHMTVLDDGDLMMVEARLSAQGLKKQPAGTEAPPTPGILKKKSLTAPTEVAVDDTATAPEPAPPPRKEAKDSALKKALPKPSPKKLPGKKDEAADDIAPPAPEPEPVVELVRKAPPRPPVEVPPPAPAVVASVAPVEPPPIAPAVAAPPPPAPVAPPPPPPAAAPAAPPEPVAPAARADEGDAVRKLLVPQKKATIVGRIELAQDQIRDAKQRSAPAGPGNIKRQALAKLQQRSGMRPTQQSGGVRRPPAGPGGYRGGPGMRDSRGGPGGARRTKVAPTIDPTKVVEVEEPVSMKALSAALGVTVVELLQTFMLKLKVMGKNINSLLTNEEVELVGLELERNIQIVKHKEAMDELVEQLVEESEGEQEMLRAPVVTFMGHVDHGKTSLMDALHQSDVAKHEAGGITQHIGAYKVTGDDGKSIVILDTPGHAAFTAMRARGAQLTDIVVLVVAGDDGVMPQTEEAIAHAKAANVPIVVAITKSDLPSSKPKQVKQQLMIKGLQSEDFGGTTGMVEVSAVTKKGLPELLERIHLESEILDLRARPDAGGKGIVVESRQSPEQGVVVTLLVTDGTLRLKDQVVCGESFARIRAMIDDHGNNLEEAGPSTPVTLFGLDRLPSPGDKLFAVEDAKKAKEVVEERQRRLRELGRAERSAVTLETLSAKLAEKNVREIKLILKADAMGSLEPLRKCLEELSTTEVRVNLVHSALGGINETDVSLAEASGAVIVGFHTIADSSARQAAEAAGVEIRYYDVIYELLDQVKAAMEGLLAPQEVQNVIGHAEVKATFKSSKFGTIAGCRVTDGIVRRSAIARLSREGTVVWSGKLGSLRRVEEDVRDVKAGLECGMTLDGFQDIKVGDVLEFVQIELVKRTLGG